MAQKEIVLNIKLEATEAIQQLKALAVNTKDLKDRKKELSSEISKEEKALKELAKAGKDTTLQTEKLAKVNKLNTEEIALLDAALAGNSGRARELRNDISGLTAEGIRFRDKMAQATLEAINQSGVLGQLDARANALETELKELNAAYKAGTVTQKQFNDQQNKLQQELGETAHRSELVQKEILQLEQEFKKGAISAEQFKAGVQKVNSAVEANTGAFKAGVTNLKNYALGFFGVVAATQAIIGGIKATFDIIAEFDKALSGVRALGGEYSENIEQLGEAAKNAGINFGFTATESVGAIEALAKAGVSTTDILGGALQGALTLAAAGNLDVAVAAETAAKAMTQFGLSGQDIPRLADLLAAGAATATGDVTDFAQALNQAGLVAAQTGIPIEDTIGTLTAFASAGLLGSDAGTSFRSMLLKLQNPSKESAKLMEDLGISTFDANGEFIGLEKLAGTLQEKLKGLTQEQRSAALAQIFGSDAVRAANVLYTQGAEGIAGYVEQVNQSGFAAEVAAEQTNNLTGDLDRAKGAWEKLVLGLEDGSGVIATSLRNAINAVSGLLLLLTESDDALGQNIGTGKGSAIRDEASVDAYRESIKELTEARATDEKWKDKSLASTFALNSVTEQELKNMRDRTRVLINGIKTKEDAVAMEKRLTDAIAAQPPLLEKNARAGVKTAELQIALNELRKKSEVLLSQESEAAAKAADVAAEAAAAAAAAAANGAAQSDVATEKTTKQAAAQRVLTDELREFKPAQDAINDSIRAREALLNAFTDSQLTAQQREENAIRDKYFTEVTLAEDAAAEQKAIVEKLAADIQAAKDAAAGGGGGIPGLPTGDEADAQIAILEEQYATATALLAQFNDSELELTAALNAEIARLRKEAGEQQLSDQKEINEALISQEQQLTNAQNELALAKLDAAAALASTLGGLAEEGSKTAKMFFALEKAAAIASVIVKLQQELALIRASTAAQSFQANLLPGGAALVPGIQAIGIAQMVKAKVQAGIGIASIAAQAISGFAEGGYTGHGGKYEPAGVVHRGEYVLPQEVVRSIGVRNLDALRSMYTGAAPGRGSYATGGMVQATLDSGSILAAQNAAAANTMTLQPVLPIESLRLVQNRVAVREQRSTL